MLFTTSIRNLRVSVTARNSNTCRQAIAPEEHKRAAAGTRLGVHTRRTHKTPKAHKINAKITQNNPAIPAPSVSKSVVNPEDIETAHLSHLVSLTVFVAERLSNRFHTPRKTTAARNDTCNPKRHTSPHVIHCRIKSLTLSHVLVPERLSNRSLRHPGGLLAQGGPVRAHVRDVPRLVQRLNRKGETADRREDRRLATWADIGISTVSRTVSRRD